MKTKKYVTIIDKREIIKTSSCGIDNVYNKPLPKIFDDALSKLPKDDFDITYNGMNYIMGGVGIELVDDNRQMPSFMAPSAEYYDLLRKIGFNIVNPLILNCTDGAVTDSNIVDSVVSICQTAHSVDYADIKMKVLFNNMANINNNQIYNNDQMIENVNPSRRCYKCKDSNKGIIDFSDQFTHTISEAGVVTISLNPENAICIDEEVIAITDIILYEDMGDNDIYIIRALSILDEVWVKGDKTSSHSHCKKHLSFSMINM